MALRLAVAEDGGTTMGCPRGDGGGAGERNKAMPKQHHSGPGVQTRAKQQGYVTTVHERRAATNEIHCVECGP